MDEALANLSRLAMDLHRGARTQPMPGFIDWALAQLERHVAFDGAVWGSGYAAPPEFKIHTVHVHGLPSDFMADYAQVHAHDDLHLASVQQRGVAVFADSTCAPAGLRPFLDKHRLRFALSVTDADPLTTLLNVIAIYRFEGRDAFTPAERLFVQAAVPHLNEACTANRLQHLLAATGPRLPGPWRPAAADRTGLLHHADNDFSRLLVLEWPDWRGPYLPLPLIELVRSTSTGRAATVRFVGQAVVVKFATLGDLLLVQARESVAVDRLSERERQVAAYTAQGLNHKAIARLLGLAPATVRNHLAAACRRVQVNSKAQVAALVQGFE